VIDRRAHGARAGGAARRRRCADDAGSGKYAPVDRPWLAWLLVTAACGGGSQSSRTVFDPTGGIAPVDVSASADLEHAYPPLDGAGGAAESGGAGGVWMGVSVLHDGVRFPRPRQWTVRDASLEPRHSYIRYVSPNAYSFAIYERADDTPGESWADIFQRYEGDVAASGAKIVGEHIAMATAANQARAYTIEHKIDAKPPIVSRSRELLARGERRVVLIQIVTDEDSLARVAPEVLGVLNHLEVL